jgi:hypothetical protein
MRILAVWGRSKTKPIKANSNPIKANSKPILTQNKAKQSQFFGFMPAKSVLRVVANMGNLEKDETFYPE